MAVDKMWDVLRFLKGPEDGNPVPEASVKAKEEIDSKLIEALGAAEKAAEAAVANERHGNELEYGQAVQKSLFGDDIPQEEVQQDVPVAKTHSALQYKEESGTTHAEEAVLSGATVQPEPVYTTIESVAAGGRNYTDDAELVNVPIDSVRPNPYQPRMVMDEEELDQLAASIREVGVLQPILVRPFDGGYELVAGERRLRAAKRAGMTHIPAVVRDVDAAGQQLMALVENLQRKNLSSIEEGKCLADLIERTGWSQTELAVRLGRSQASVANKMRLLKLDSEVQQLVIAGRLGERQARALLALAPEEQRHVAYKAVEEELNTRDIERLVGVTKEPKEGTGRHKKPSSASLVPGAEGTTGELLKDLSVLVNKYRGMGVPAQWKVRELAQNALVVEIVVDMKPK